MLRVLCLVVALGGAAQAAPAKRKPSALPALADAERAWAAADAETDVAKSVPLWEAAGEAFVAAAEKLPATSPDRKDAALGAVLAWKNALNVDPRVKQTPSKVEDVIEDSKVPKPKTIPDREQKILRAFERYLAIDRTSDDAIAIAFTSANIYRRYNAFDKAPPIFREIIEKHPKHEAAELAANLTLDTYNRMQDYDKLIAFAEKLRADKAFLANREDLQSVVDKIHIQSTRKAAERCERRARDTRDKDMYDECGAMYLALSRDAVNGFDFDELVYNAAICFQEAGSIERAISVMSAVPEKSKLRPRANIRIGHMHARMIRFGEAATRYEELALKFPGEMDAARLASEALFYRLALGELGRAEKILTFAQRTFMKARRDLESSTWHLAWRYLEAGQRADAMRVAAFASEPTEPAVRIPAARTLLAVACSVPLIDDECAGTMDSALLEKARRIVKRAPSSSEQRTLSLDLETPAVRESGYQALLESSDPWLRIAAHARLGALALANKQRETGLRLLTRCAEDAIAHTQHRWLLACDRLLATAGAAVEGIGEVRSRPQSGRLSVELEPAVSSP